MSIFPTQRTASGLLAKQVNNLQISKEFSDAPLRAGVVQAMERGGRTLAGMPCRQRQPTYAEGAGIVMNEAEKGAEQHCSHSPSEETRAVNPGAARRTGLGMKAGEMSGRENRE